LILPRFKRLSDWKRPLVTLPWLVLLAWFALIGASLVYNVLHSLQLEREMALGQARGYVAYNKIARLWNAGHGGVYAPVGPETPPNPYLEAANREITGPGGETLTLINPAYMSRQISTIAGETGTPGFRLTSLKLKNPANVPTAREAEYLRAFELGAPDGGEIVRSGGGRELFYMSKFRVREPCLQCHADKGYQLGDVRGGISVRVPLKDVPNIAEPVLTHIVLLLAGGALLGFGAQRTRRDFLSLADQASTDTLSRLPNRGALQRHLQREFRRARRHGYPMSLLVIDIDEFKHFNDYFGHRAGDECLKRIAAALEAALRRPGDYIGRYGGEEFLVVLGHVDPAEARLTGERLRAAVEALAQPAAPAAGRAVVTVSVGVAALKETDGTPETLFDRADAAMYRAKRSGKNAVSG
jgi:diguanylate cyclase (GGDEF)-like protein